MLIGLIGVLYMVIFGALTILRHEGLSFRFVVESMCVTAIAILLVVLAAIQIHPVIFLLLLYAVTMRVRILTDLANVIAGRGNFLQAEKIYDLASRLWPDRANEQLIDVNHAILLLQKNQLNESIAMFNDILSESNKDYLGIKYKAAAHYNLGVAYQREENHDMAIHEFKAVLDTWPASLYAHRAQKALERLGNNHMADVDNQPPEG